MKGRRWVKDTFLNLETIETWIVCVSAIQRVNGQDKRFKCVWTEYGSRCQAHRFECVKNCNGAGVFTLNSFQCVSRIPTSQRTSSQLWEALESTWTSIPVERSQHLVESMPGRIEAVLRAKGGGGCNWILRKVFLMFSILSVYCR